MGVRLSGVTNAATIRWLSACIGIKFVVTSNEHRHMAKNGDTFTFIYQERDNKPTIAATGAYGGVTPDGKSVVAHLYVEYSTVPSLSEHDIGEGGIVDLLKGDVIKRAEATRDIQATLVLSPEAAQALGKFLSEKARNALKMREGTSKEDKG